MGSLAVYGDITDRRDRTGERMIDWFSVDNWPPATQTGLNPVVDVEDISMMTMQLDNGVLASYQQCHFTPDYWRSYTVIGSEGRLENFGNGEDGSCIKVWNRRKWGYSAPDEVHMIGNTTGEQAAPTRLSRGNSCVLRARAGRLRLHPSRRVTASRQVAPQRIRCETAAFPLMSRPLRRTLRSISAQSNETFPFCRGNDATPARGDAKTDRRARGRDAAIGGACSQGQPQCG